MTNFNADIEYFHKIDKEFKQIILKSFKGLMIDGQGNSGPNFHATISEYNRFFESTDYFYNGNLEFFHLTSIQNLLSILNARAFRFYNAHSSKDPEEYKYAANLLKLTDEEVQHRKEYLYTFSFCPITELENKEVWKIYGDNFQGAGIKFKIINEPKNWTNYHMSDVKYDEPKHFNTYLEDISRLEKMYQITARCDLSKLIAFHKMPKWNEEKEVRLITYFPYKHLDEYFKYSKTEFRIESNRNRITHYIDLPIWVNNESNSLKSNRKELDRSQDLPIEYFETKPKIQITDILLGEKCGIEPHDLDRFRTALLDLVSFNYGYNVNIEPELFKIPE